MGILPTTKDIYFSYTFEDEGMIMEGSMGMGYPVWIKLNLESQVSRFHCQLGPCSPKPQHAWVFPLSLDRVTCINSHRFLWKRTEEVMTMYYSLPTAAGSFFVVTWLLPQAKNSGIKAWPCLGPGQWIEVLIVILSLATLIHPWLILTKDWAIPFWAAVYLTPKGSAIKGKKNHLPETLRVWIIRNQT